MPGAERWLWLGGSFLIALAATGVSWIFRHRTWAEQWTASPLFAPLLHFLRFLYYVGGPFAALIWGRDAVVERLLGLSPFPAILLSPLSPEDRMALWLDGVRDVGWAVFLGVAAGATLAIIQRVANGTGPAPETPFGTLREAVFQEIHWMFYRNGPVVALGAYWGTWAGLGLVALEAALNPWWWAALRTPEKRPLTLVRTGMAVLSAVFYLQAASLWLSILLHWGVVGGWVAGSRRRSAAEGRG